MDIFIYEQIAPNPAVRIKWPAQVIEGLEDVAEVLCQSSWPKQLGHTYFVKRKLQNLSGKPELWSFGFLLLEETNSVCRYAIKFQRKFREVGDDWIQDDSP